MSDVRELDAFLRKLSKTDPEILVWIRSLLVIRDRLPDYEAAVDALKRAVPLVEDEWEGTSDDTAGMEWLRTARAVLARLREAMPA